MRCQYTTSYCENSDSSELSLSRLSALSSRPESNCGSIYVSGSGAQDVMTPLVIAAGGPRLREVQLDVLVSCRTCTNGRDFLTWRELC